MMTFPASSNGPCGSVVCLTLGKYFRSVFAAERLEGPRQQPAEHDARNNAERDPDGQITLKSAECRHRLAPADFSDGCHDNSSRERQGCAARLGKLSAL